MNPLNNPFSPGAGTQPPEIVGRSEILMKAKILFGRLQKGRSEQSLILIGLRGVGKTVLLNLIDEEAKSQNFKTIFIEAHEGKSLVQLLVPNLRKILLDLDRAEQIGQKVKRALRVFKGFLNAIQIKYNDIEIGLDIDPEIGTADSGDIENDLVHLFEAIAEAAQDKKTCIAIIIDELQYLNEIEMSALIMAIHKISQRNLPLTLVGAGLPQIIALSGRSKSYAERLFSFPQLGPLTFDESITALREPINKEGAHINDQALKEIFHQTQGYPYFIQEWGYQAWNIGELNTIDLNVAMEATKKSISKLDQSFFRVRFDRLTPSEKKYLRAMAEIGTGPHRSGDIAIVLKQSVQSLAPVRSSLIKKGMIYSPSHGDTDFTVPLFHQFMKRVMPEL
jgi:hypothetical protein